jgi:filamentous hemagglutinin
MAAALSQLRPQQVAQFEDAIALRNAGKGVEADAVLGRLRSALGEKNFREIESHILARAGGSLEPGNPNSRSFSRNGKREVLNQADAPKLPNVACGPTTCGMILNDAGKPVNLNQLLQQAGTNDKGSFINKLSSTLKSHGINNARWGVRVPLDDLAKATSKGHPAIVHVNLNRGGHFVIVDGVTVRQGQKVVAIRDPAGGRQYFTPIDEFMQKYSGQALFTNPVKR